MGAEQKIRELQNRLRNFKRVLKSGKFKPNKLDYDFKRLKKVDNDTERYSRYDAKRDKKSKKKLRSPLNRGEIVYVLSARIKKKKRAIHFL